MPYKEHHKYERGMKDARYDIDEVEDFPRGDTWEEAEAEYHWDTCVQMDMERRVEQGDVAEVPEVTVAESAAVVDRTQAAEEAREAERQRHKQWLVEREEQRRAALVELASLAEAIAECPLCPLVSLDRLDAGTLRALYARHEHEQHDREEEETPAVDKKAAPEDGEDEYSGVVEPVRVRPDGTPVFDINALPVDVWGVLMYYLDPYSLIQVCYASNWLRVLAEDCGAWEMCWSFIRLHPKVRMDTCAKKVAYKIKIACNMEGLRQANKQRSRALARNDLSNPVEEFIQRRLKREKRALEAKAQREGNPYSALLDSSSDDDIFSFIGVVAVKKPTTSRRVQPSTAYRHLHSQPIQFKPKPRGELDEYTYTKRSHDGFVTHYSNEQGVPLEADSHAIYLLDNPMKGGRAFPWSIFLSFRHRLYICLENEWQRWVDLVPSRPYNYFYCYSLRKPPPQYPQPDELTKDSESYNLLLDTIKVLQKDQGRLGAIANLELYRQATKQETRLFAAYRANLAAGMLHTASDYFEQVDFSKIPENTKLMLGAPRTEAAFAAARSELSMRCLDVMAEDEVDVVTQDYSAGAAKLFVKVGRDAKSTIQVFRPNPSHNQVDACDTTPASKPHTNQNHVVDLKAERAEHQMKNVDAFMEARTPSNSYQQLKWKLRTIGGQKQERQLLHFRDLQSHRYNERVELKLQRAQRRVAKNEKKDSIFDLEVSSLGSVSGVDGHSLFD